MPQQHKRVVLHLTLNCRDPSGEELKDFLREAIPFYESLPGVKIRLLEGPERGRFVEVVEYESENAFDRDHIRLSEDPKMINYIARWRELLIEPPLVEQLTEVTSEI